MKLYKIVIFLFIIISSDKILAQNSDTLLLSQCYDLAAKNYPEIRKKNLYNEANKYELKNINSAWLPQISLNANASYQSDVAQISIPGLPINFDIPKDRYDIFLQIDQTIFDAGKIKSNYNSQKLKTQINNSASDIEIYKIYEKINDLFFAAIFAQRQIDIYSQLQTELYKRKKTVEAGINAGIMTPVAKYMLENEITKVEVKIQDLKHDYINSLEILSILIDSNLTSNNKILEADINDFGQEARGRPEMIFFDTKNQFLDANKKLVKSNRYPVAKAFAKLGYGKPGLNFLGNEFDTYYIIGVAVKWNIPYKNEVKRKLNVIDINKDINLIDKEKFEKQNNMAVIATNNKITKLENQIKADDKIIKNNQYIADVYKSRFERGTIRFDEYFDKLNELIISKLNKELHEIMLIKAKSELDLLKGKIN